MYTAGSVYIIYRYLGLLGMSGGYTGERVGEWERLEGGAGIGMIVGSVRGLMDTGGANRGVDTTKCASVG